LSFCQDLHTPVISKIFQEKQATAQLAAKLILLEIRDSILRIKRYEVYEFKSTGSWVGIRVECLPVLLVNGALVVEAVVVVAGLAVDEVLVEVGFLVGFI
jgi:hypothetical protein